MIIKDIFDGNSSEELHSDFLKFGKGEYKNKYLTQAKKQKDSWIIKTGHEFANFFVKKCLENAHGEIRIKGCIVSTFDLSEEIKFQIEKIKNFMGIRQIIINTSVNPQNILNLMEKYPRVFFALSFSIPDCDLKIKAKAPKSAKPSTKTQEEPKVDFCSLKTTNKEIIRELFFDVPDFNEIKIKHIIKINEIIYPIDEKDPVKIRELSKRKGILIREIEADGKKEVFEKEFIA